MQPSSSEGLDAFETCEKCAVPKCEIEDVVARRRTIDDTGSEGKIPRSVSKDRNNSAAGSAAARAAERGAQAAVQHETHKHNMHASARTHSYIHTHAHARARAYARTHTQSCSHTHIHTHANVRTHKHAHTHIIIEATRWDKVFVEEGVGAAILSPKFEWPWSYRPF
jgi:hypothetical protein